MKHVGRSSNPVLPTITIRISGTLFQGHLLYLDHLVKSATECRLWPMLSLEGLRELDRAALLYLSDGENRHFGIQCCPRFIRQWTNHERATTAA